MASVLKTESELDIECQPMKMKIAPGFIEDWNCCAEGDSSRF